MGTYYKHKASRNRSIPYTFQCEHCLQDSGALTAVVQGSEAEYNSLHKTMTDEQKAKLDQSALQNLKREIRQVHKDAETKRKFSLAFRDECPHCGKSQSWGIAGRKGDAASTVKLFLLLAVVAGGGTYLTQGRNLQVSLLIAGAFVLIGAAVFLVKSVGVGKRAKQAGAALQQNLPTIDWSAARDLIGESE